MLSLLFDMNQLWEEYILKQVKKYAQKHQPDFNVTGQDSKKFLGVKLRFVRIIVISNDEDTFIIDTKWKRPRDKGAKISDLRQMYAYNKFWNAKRAMLLYPGHSDGEVFSSFYDGEGNNLNADNQCMLGVCSCAEARWNRIGLG